jgi:hypothetical protein
VKAIQPICWFAVYRYNDLGLQIQPLEFFPAVDKHEAKEKAFAKLGIQINELVALEAYGETCCCCQRGFLMISDGTLYTHALCPDCCVVNKMCSTPDSIAIATIPNPPAIQQELAPAISSTCVGVKKHRYR